MTPRTPTRWPWIAALAMGLALRLFFVLAYPAPSGDGPIYQELAKNWLSRGIYGLADLSGRLIPTDGRLPGYPAFLAAISFVFRRGDLPLLLAQVAVDLATCWLVAVLAGWLAPPESRRRARLAAFWLAALCPFVANYTAVVLTEVLATFLTVLALVAFAGCFAGRETLAPRIGKRSLKISAWFAAGLAAGLGTLVRPETPLLLIVFALVMLWRAARKSEWRNLARVGLLSTAGFLLPLIPWGIRNAISLHEFQFLAPRYAQGPDDFVPRGFNSWTATWLVSFNDVYLTQWKLDNEKIPPSDVPDAAFDTPEERARVTALLTGYNADCCEVTQQFDNQFAALARERTARHPMRTYFTVPVKRALTLWLTPRIELLPISGKLWPLGASFQEDSVDFSVTLLLGALGIAYVALAAAGLSRALRRHLLAEPERYVLALLVTFCIVRTIFFTQLETPEPRYVLECFPAVFAMAALLWLRPSVDSPHRPS